MYKIKLIKGRGCEELEYKVNSFMEDKLPLEVNIQKVGEPEVYLASIIYTEAGNSSRVTVSSRVMPEVRTVLLSETDKSPQTPFDRLASGMTLKEKD